MNTSNWTNLIGLSHFPTGDNHTARVSTTNPGWQPPGLRLGCGQSFRRSRVHPGDGDGRGDRGADHSVGIERRRDYLVRGLVVVDIGFRRDGLPAVSCRGVITDLPRTESRLRPDRTEFEHRATATPFPPTTMPALDPMSAEMCSSTTQPTEPGAWSIDRAPGSFGLFNRRMSG